ncbi:hypothetical protein U9M48_040786 [Paspalum notatum var. saurae]|uniref:TPR1-like CTLH-containing domain-containing protein n=1 Tax=Paspalum notatum var. saurae TaxID=547442 RepID=A0AAQ3UMF4_PASNO
MGTPAAEGVDQPDERRASRRRDLSLIVLQHLREEGFKETAHSLEQESGLKHLEDLVQCGAWDDAERYLGGFTGAGGKEDPFSAIRRHKYLEDLGRWPNHLAVLCAEFLVPGWRMTAKDRENVTNHFKVLYSCDEEAAKMVSALENFRQDERLDTPLIRNVVFLEIKNLIEANPLFKDKLDFPLSEASRLRTMGNRSPNTRPEVLTLYSDHYCHSSRDGAKSETEEQKMGARRAKVESEKMKTWKLADIYNSGHLRSLCMPEPDKLATTLSKVVGLLYTSDGTALWALGSNAIFKCWNWQQSDRNPNRKSFRLNMWDPSQVLCTFNGPPPTFITFHPDDHQIVAFGMNDTTILVCSYVGRQICITLRGHQNRITGLAFPQARMVLVSSSADGQICVWWDLSGGVKKNIKIHPIFRKLAWSFGRRYKGAVSNSIDFLLISDYIQWPPRDTLPAPISSAVCSCDGLLVYAGSCDGAIGIFEAKSLSLRCRIAPYAYIPPSISLSVTSVGHIDPVVVSAYPLKPNQIALGMSDGTVHVLEPLDEEPNQGGEHYLPLSTLTMEQT